MYNVFLQIPVQIQILKKSIGYNLRPSAATTAPIIDLTTEIHMKCNMIYDWNKIERFDQSFR